jgi:hypothetical protein
MIVRLNVPFEALEHGIFLQARPRSMRKGRAEPIGFNVQSLRSPSKVKFGEHPGMAKVCSQMKMG